MAVLVFVNKPVACRAGGARECFDPAAFTLKPAVATVMITCNMFCEGSVLFENDPSTRAENVFMFCLCVYLVGRSRVLSQFLNAMMECAPITIHCIEVMEGCVLACMVSVTLFCLESMLSSCRDPS